MGRNIDKTHIQMRMLIQVRTSRTVHFERQADKFSYQHELKKQLKKHQT